MNIQINTFNLSGNQIVTGVRLDESTPQELNLMRLAREDGAKLISSTYAPKEITISGIIKGTSRSDLETNIDTFKKNTMITEGDLDVDYEVGYRRWTVDCSGCIVTREHHNISTAAFELKYVASDPPFAEEIDSIAGNPKMNGIYSVDMITANICTADLDLGGTAKPKPKLDIFIDAAGNLNNVSVKNNTTNTQMDITTAWGSGDALEINTNSRIVQKNSSNVEYEGIFPEFNLGDNDIDINFTSIGNPNQEQAIYNSDADINSNWVAEAQSFQITPTSNYSQIDLLLKKASSFDYDEWLETFSATTYKDVANTTANWETANSELKFGYSGSSIVDSYSESNYTDDTYMARLGAGGINYVAQSFIGNGKTLNSAKFYLKKYGSPTGTMVAYLWAHAGTYGLDGYPIAPLYATSNSLDVSTLTTNSQLIEFTFSSNFKLVNGVKYMIGIGYMTGGGGANYVLAGYDTSPSHAGNGAYYNNGAWYPDQTIDYIFYVYGKNYDTTANVGQSLGFDTGKTSNTFVSGTQSVTLNGGTSTLEFSDSADNSSWSSWTTDITTLSRRYIRFRITLTGTTTASPLVDYVTINWVGNIEVNICSDTAGAPGAILSIVYIPYTSIGTSYGWASVSMSVNLTAATNYWVWIRPSSTNATARTFYWAYQNTNIYASGLRARKTSSGGSWTTYSTNDHAFKVYIDESPSWEISARIEYQKKYL
ncbi:MAG TPA: choice-of-anchor R domain-containing protein [Williamwhitmania sp.]|nr:choice-of-anchor R domain-containing protein [Williamwhitmania sp.]